MIINITKNMNTWVELLQFPFLQRALVVGILIGLTTAVLGVFVTLRKMSFFSDAISHSALVGIALGILLHLNPFLAAVGFVVLISLSMGFVTERTKLSPDTVIGVFFSSSVALGVLIISLLKGYRADLFAYLFGDILAVSQTDVWMSLILAAAVLGVMFWKGKAWIRLSLNPEMAQVDGLRVKIYDYIFLVIMALTVAVALKVIGIILVSALVIIPAAAAKGFAGNFRSLMLWSMLISIISAVAGLFLSFQFDTSSGPTIVLVATVFFLLSFIPQYLRKSS
ncbi:MAG: metal ABC transporter permease [Patescibacteria group bacterium]